MLTIKLDELVSVCHWIAQQGWTPATSGNMSVREDNQWCWLSESGKDKGAMTRENFLRVAITNNFVPSGGQPSAETGLHTLIYRLFPAAQAVLHVHTVSSTVLSRLRQQSQIMFSGYELQKALAGQDTHRNTITLPVFDNQQDIALLAQKIEQSQQPLEYGFLLRGHGLTCWGRSVIEARRHLECLEFLCTCELQQHLWKTL